MELILKTLTALASIIGPLVIAFWNNRHLSKKHTKDEFEVDVKIAERFEEIHQLKTSHLVKDRLAQQLFMTKKITYFEVLFFYQYSDMERWINDYIRCKDKVKLIQNSNGKIIKIHHPHSRLKVFGFSVGYVVFAILALLPFLYINSFIEIYESQMASKQYLIIFNMFAWPILSAILAIILLIEGAKYNAIKSFIKKFESNAIKI